jgi:hypothetical protein
MRRVIATLGLALCALGCGSTTPRAAQVPLPTDETVAAYGQSCILMHQVVDVTADPTTGTPVLTHVGQVRWPKGFTAWRVGSEVEVLDSSGNVVLTTGSRYWVCPSVSPNYDWTSWVVGMVKPCPDCALGPGVD